MSTTDTPTPRTQTLEQRFLAKVSKTPECWIWTASLNGNGYGEIYERPGSDKKIQAHRASYLIHRGQIPEGMNVTDAPLPSAGAAKPNLS